jgi:hypothetical protein
MNDIYDLVMLTLGVKYNGVVHITNPSCLTLYVPGIPKWDAECNKNGIPTSTFGISYWVTRDGFRAEPKEYVGKQIIHKRQF